MHIHTHSAAAPVSSLLGPAASRPWDLLFLRLLLESSVIILCTNLMVHASPGPPLDTLRIPPSRHADVWTLLEIVPCFSTPCL